MSDNPLVGVWKLVSCEALRGQGTGLPVYGKRPIGRLYYDGAGNMSVHIMRSGRRRLLGATRSCADEAEIKSAYEGYEAYFSTYTVDTERAVVRHEVQGSLFPNWTGSTQVRYFRLLGPDRLIMRTAPFGTSSLEQAVVELVWDRMQ